MVRAAYAVPRRSSIVTRRETPDLSPDRLCPCPFHPPCGRAVAACGVASIRSAPPCQPCGSCGAGDRGVDPIQRSAPHAPVPRAPPRRQPGKPTGADLAELGQIFRTSAAAGGDRRRRWGCGGAGRGERFDNRSPFENAQASPLFGWRMGISGDDRIGFRAKTMADNSRRGRPGG